MATADKPRSDSNARTAPNRPKGNDKTRSTGPETKNAKVLALLGRSGGTTLEELTDATGWKNHTTRAALTGLRKKGHTITRAKVDGTSRYRIGGAAT